jgi:hypothetical protein
MKIERADFIELPARRAGEWSGSANYLQVRLRQCSGQYANRHSLLQGPVQHFKPTALKETLGGFCKNMKPLRSRTGYKLDSGPNYFQAVSTPPPIPNDIQTCKPWIQIQPRRAVAENNTPGSDQFIGPRSTSVAGKEPSAF